MFIPESITDVISSYSKEHNSFRWLLFVAEGQIKRISLSQMQQLAKEIKVAREEGQKPYVVVRFAVPRPKVIIMPAESVLGIGRVRSERGGIPWFE